jgi:DinB superfamily
LGPHAAGRWHRAANLEAVFCPAKLTADFHRDYSFLSDFFCEENCKMDPRYPIGKFEMLAAVTPALRHAAIEKIAETPAKFRAAVRGLSDAQMDTPYRDGGWTVRQVVHHVPDSHVNAYVRLKLALTESSPTIKPYAEDKWAQLADSRSTPIEVSLSLLESTHTRWVIILRSLTEADFARKLIHPEHGERNVDWLIFLYAWHGPHHTAHITELRKQRGW